MKANRKKSLITFQMSSRFLNLAQLLRCRDGTLGSKMDAGDLVAPRHRSKNTFIKTNFIITCWVSYALPTPRKTWLRFCQFDIIFLLSPQKLNLAARHLEWGPGNPTRPRRPQIVRPPRNRRFCPRF